MTPALYFRRLDYVLIGAVMAIATLGWLTVDSATRADIPDDPGYYGFRHGLNLVLGALAGVVLSAVDPRRYRALLWPIYGVTISLLVVVLGLAAARGSTRWISIGSFNLQPSEIGKLAVIVCLAAFLGDRAREHAGSWSTLGLAILFVAPPAVLVFIEPDLGTSIVYAAITVTILFIAGARLVQLAALGGVAALALMLVFVALPRAGVQVLEGYQMARLTSFLNPTEDLGDAAYQVNQSKIAIGSGALVGKGVAGATQTTDNFLPEHHTDFIFAVVGEQRGFVGAALLLGLYVLVIWRAARSITLAASLFESLIAAGIAGMFLTQIFVNIGMTIGIMPTTGIPLPFMTYGGSNTLVNIAAVGLLCAVQIRGGVPVPPPLASHDVVVNARRRFGEVSPPPLVRR